MAEQTQPSIVIHGESRPVCEGCSFMRGGCGWGSGGRKWGRNGGEKGEIKWMRGRKWRQCCSLEQVGQGLSWGLLPLFSLAVALFSVNLRVIYPFSSPKYPKLGLPEIPVPTHHENRPVGKSKCWWYWVSFFLWWTLCWFIIVSVCKETAWFHLCAWSKWHEYQPKEDSASLRPSS